MAHQPPLDRSLGKKRDETLRESEDRYRALFDEARHGILLTILDGTIIDANPTACVLLGMTKEEICARGCAGLLEQNPALAAVLEERETKGHASAELIITRDDGTQFPAEVSSAAISEATGSWSSFIAFRDLSERNRIEKALRQSEDLFSKAFHGSPVPMVIARRKDATWVDANDSLLRMIGYSREEVIGRTSRDLNLLDSDAYAEIARQMIDQETVHEPEALARTRSGKPLHLLISKERIEFAGEACTMLIMFDITEQKQVELALAESEERYRNLLQVAPVGILVDQDDRIVFINPAGLSLLGAESHGQVMGKRISQIVHPDTLQAAKARLRRMLAGEAGVYPAEGRYVRLDGTVIDAEVMASPLTYRGAPAVQLIMTDITERKQAKEKHDAIQAQLFQAQKTESIGRLAGSIAHDFNNMLGIILGYGEGVLSQLHEGDPLWEDVKEIVEAGRRSASLTQQLLAFSRKQTLQPEILNLNALVADLEGMLRRLIGEHIELEFSLAEGLALVMADPSQIEHVIMNLAINARDAMPQGGKLTIETKNVEIDETYAETHPEVEPGDYVLVALTDTGCGMNESVLSHAFEPFYTSKEKGQGTGLGLSTAQGVIRQSGGSISIYSEPGRGTTMKIYLPQTQSGSETKEEENRLENRAGGGEQILVVEDEPSLRYLFEKMLTKLGYQVTLAANGDEALLLVEEEGLEPDLLVTDVVMPGMSGSALAERLEQRRPGLRVLYMSGYSDEAIVHHGVLAPGTPFLQKPVSMAALAAKIQDILRGAD